MKKFDFSKRFIALSISACICMPMFLCSCKAKTAESTEENKWFACTEVVNRNAPYYLLRDGSISHGLTDDGKIPMVMAEDSFTPESVTVGLVSTEDFEIEEIAEIDVDPYTMWSETYAFVINGKAYLEIDTADYNEIDSEYKLIESNMPDADIGTDLLVTDCFDVGGVSILVAKDTADLFGEEDEATHLLFYNPDSEDITSPVDVNLNVYSGNKSLTIEYIFPGNDSDFIVFCYDYEAEETIGVSIDIDFSDGEFSYSLVGTYEGGYDGIALDSGNLIFDNTGLYTEDKTCMFDYSMTDCSMTLMEYLEPVCVSDNRIVMAGFVYNEDYSGLEFRMYTFDRTGDPAQGREIIEIGVEEFVPNYLNTVVERFNEDSENAFARLKIISGDGVNPVLNTEIDTPAYASELRSFITGESAPDVMIFNYPHYIYGEENIFVNLSDSIDTTGLFDFAVEMDPYTIPVLFYAVGIANTDAPDVDISSAGEFFEAGYEAFYGEGEPFHNDEFYSFLRDIKDIPVTEEDDFWNWDFDISGELVLIAGSDDLATLGIESLYPVAGNELTVMGSQIMAVTQNSCATAIDFVQFCLSPEIQSDIAVGGFGLPVNSEAYMEISDNYRNLLCEMNDEQSVLYNEIPDRIGYSYVVNDNVVQVFNNLLPEYMAGNYSEEEVADLLVPAL